MIDQIKTSANYKILNRPESRSKPKRRKKLPVSAEEVDKVLVSVFATQMKFSFIRFILRLRRCWYLDNP